MQKYEKLEKIGEGERLSFLNYSLYLAIIFSTILFRLFLYTDSRNVCRILCISVYMCIF